MMYTLRHRKLWLWRVQAWEYFPAHLAHGDDDDDDDDRTVQYSTLWYRIGVDIRHRVPVQVPVYPE